jgi:hypothetical protein
LGNGEIYLVTPPAASAAPSGTFQVGYMEIPQNLQSASYQLVLADRSKSILCNFGSGQTLTIPANASVPFLVGTTIMIIAGGNSQTIAITSDTLDWLPSVTSGSRTLAAHGVATLYKAAATTWYIWGFGLS